MQIVPAVHVIRWAEDFLGRLHEVKAEQNGALAAGHAAKAAARGSARLLTALSSSTMMHAVFGR
jgi:hypothetical protein